jgi:hypothetical protein
LYILTRLQRKAHFLANKTEKALFFVVKNKEDINAKNIIKHFDTNIFIPSIFDSKF